jgi:hypothetical protein
MAQRYGRHLVNPVPGHSASRRISQSLLNVTIEFQSHEAVIEQNHEYGLYWLVASKMNKRYESPASPTGYEFGFAPRYYVVRSVDGGLISSAQDPQVSAECIAAVEAFRASQQVASHQ